MEKPKKSITLRFRKLLFSIVPKRTIFTTFENGIEFDIKETPWWIPRLFKQRYIQVNGHGYYSAVFLDPRIKRQPILREFQDVIEEWAKNNPPKHALILGSAGCALHRFLALSYRGITIDGVELSPTMIDVAKRFFMDNIKDKIHLIEANAIDYIANIEMQGYYDIVIVDLFNGDKVVPQVHSIGFISGLLSCCRPHALMLFNLNGGSDNEVQSIVTLLREVLPTINCVTKSEGRRKWIICS